MAKIATFLYIIPKNPEKKKLKNTKKHYYSSIALGTTKNLFKKKDYYETQKDFFTLLALGTTKNLFF